MLHALLDWYIRLFPETFWGRITAHVTLYAVLTGVVTTATKWLFHATFKFSAAWMALPFKALAGLIRRITKRS